MTVFRLGVLSALFAGVTFLAWVLLGSAPGLTDIHAQQRATANAVPEVNCGRACLAFILQRAGDTRTNMPQLLAGNGNSEPMSMADLQTLAKELDLPTPQVIHCEVNDLRTLPTPCILHIKTGVGHFVVLTNCGAQYYTIVDVTSNSTPLWGITHTELEQRFSGYALIFGWNSGK